MSGTETADWNVTIELWDDQSPAADVYLGECKVRLRDEFSEAGWEDGSIDRLWELSDPGGRISGERLKANLSKSLESGEARSSIGPYGVVRLKLAFALSNEPVTSGTDSSISASAV